MRPAETHRHAEALGGADRDVRAEFARRREQRQRERVRREDREPAARMQGGDRVAIIADRSERVRILKERAEDFCAGEVLTGTPDHEIDSERLGADLQHRERLRMHIAVDEKGGAFRGCGAVRERHRFRRSRSLVEQRGIGDRQPGQVGDHGLEIHQGFQPALADLRLVRGVGGVPGRVFQNVALDHRGQNRAVIALPDQRGEHLVLACNLAHAGERRSLR